MRATRKTMKLFALGLAAAAALTTTACEQEGNDKTQDSTSPSAGSARTPDADSSGEGTQDSGATGTGDSGSQDSTYRFADRQTPPKGSVCDNGGQGPYGAIESVTFGGEAPNTVIGMVLGYFECVDEGAVFKPSSARGSATDVLLDDSHLKIVVSGKLASDLGTKTPDANTFVKQLAEMQDNGELGGLKSPKFYFRIDAPSDDVNAMPDNESHIIFLYQVTDGD
ncbi:hypothetical protein QNN03_07885 [Streptomyces sp. GXMU-J15]|uniref:Lipoprotein n=1 Tax=Streptomyces fuscus TaxID=3048495 RepID=A0ABT7IUU4_9ACTN|nr:MULTISPECIES: hypothetical protein [Streptomyces]MDL2076357.1 hypothetical protein [Streptomyces fuscus]SBT89041.1 hypothetical protein GA0115233_100691 [Streptomyces sp. DI166]